MSGLELLVIAFGLFIGYWIVSRFAGGSSPPRQTGINSNAGSEPRLPPFQEEPASWHHILKVSPTATLDEIKRAYQKLIQQYHPDKVASLGEELQILCERKAKELNVAYNDALRAKGARP